MNGMRVRAAKKSYEAVEHELGHKKNNKPRQAQVKKHICLL
jgi:hypothetical protein